ncbi:MAG TPA: hypothetical protein VM573_00530 [Actinomycetota bacterium]|jgi:hypothetical protein|nr:hypothetical protein [Actinomycetota bacterium]
MDERADLPQPGDDPDAENRGTDREDPTSGPGNVSVDEPTEGAMNPGSADEWGEDQEVTNVGDDRAEGRGAAGEGDADAATS